MANGEGRHFTFGLAEVVVTRLEPDVVVQVRGDVDISNAAALEETIQQWLSTKPGDLTLECAGLRFIDSSGLNLTVRLHNELTARGHRLVLTGLTPTVRRPFEATNLTDVLDIRDSTP
jgi:anti-sigma B factor antagonist